MRPLFVTLLGILFAAVGPALWVAWSRGGFIAILLIGLVSLLALNFLEGPRADRSSDEDQGAAEGGKFIA